MKERVCRKGHLVREGTTGRPVKNRTQLMCLICNTIGEKQRTAFYKNRMKARKAEVRYFGTE